MFNTIPNATIDMVQTAKKSFVDFYVPHEKLKTTLNEFVDTQTEYTKDAVATFTKVGTDLGQLFISKNFYQESLDIFKSSLDTLYGKKAA